MQVSTPISPAAFGHALESARQVGVRGDVIGGLGAPLDGALAGRLGEVWDGIEGALKRAFRFGVDKARELRDSAIATAEAAIEAAGRSGDDLRLALLTRMQVFSQELLRGALARVDATVDVGDVQLELTSLEVSQKLIVTGSLKVSISELVALSGGGELVVGAHYARSRGA